MNFLDYHKINSAYQDSLKRTKADPLPVKQQDYYDFNTPEQDAVPESNTSQKGVLLPFKKNKTNVNSSKKSKKDSKSKKDKKKIKKEELESKAKEKKKKKSKKTKEQELESKKDSKKEEKKESRKKKKEKKESKKQEVKVELKEEKIEQIPIPKAEVKVNIPLKDFNFTTRPTPAFDFKFFDLIGVDKTNYASSIFKGHELKITSAGPVKRINNTQDWVLIVILFALFSVSWLKVFHYKKLAQYFSIFLKDRISGQVLREERPFSEKASILLFVSGLLSLALYFFQTITNPKLNFHLPTEGGGELYLKILGLLAVLFSVKIFSLKLLGHIFLLQKMATEYIYTILLFTNILGVIIVPLTISLQYVPMDTSIYFVYSGAAIIGLVFVYGLYRGLIIGIGNSTVSNFYLFIYLCTLEILPLLIVFYLLLNNLGRIFP